MAKSITIKDIAKEAGVSIALVSFVMNNRIGDDGKQKYRVSEATRDRILEVAKRLDYRPNSAARMLRQGKTGAIGVILSDLANIFYGTIARQIEKEAHEGGYTVLFGSTEEDPERFGRLVRLFLEKDVEGFIVVPCEGSGDWVEYLKASGKPFVVIDRYSPYHTHPLVITDNRGAMADAFKELRAQGARKIEMAAYSMRVSSMTDREDMFRELAGPDAKIYSMSYGTIEEDAEKAADSIIAGGADGLITASNVPGVAIIKALIRRGVKIQQDIKIVGFDYSNVYEMFSPGISYIQQPQEEMSRRAIRLLFSLISKKESGEDISLLHDRIVLKAKLIHGRQ